jgi:hypothetical protein
METPETRTAAEAPPHDRFVLRWGLFAGALLIFIAIRFVLHPEGAMRTFGLPRKLAGYELHHVIAYRDVWLGALALVFALLKDWRALAVWFAVGSLVCFADAALVAAAGGRAQGLVFHVASGVICAALAIMCWSRAKRPAGDA